MRTRSLSKPALETSVTVALVSVYMLIMAGATTGILDATAQCASWPMCTGSIATSPLLIVAWAHRLLALITGVLIFAAMWQAITTTSSRRVILSLLFAVGLYPIQIGIGAGIALNGPNSFLSGLHLLVGMTIFTTLLLALVWILTPTFSLRSISTTADSPTSPRTTSSPHRPGSLGVYRRARAYLSLTKPRLMWLLCLVAAAGMALAAGRSLTLSTALLTFLGGILAIGASGTFNHVLERDVDQRMDRTADRPLATAEISPWNAFVFGLVLAAASVGVFSMINWLAAALGLAAILYYSVVYTLVLKPNTVQNTVVGGFAGSFPALIGAAAATNTIGLPAVLLAIVIFLWTPAHFYNLALAYKDDYARGDIPMLPVIHGDQTTLRHIWYYLGATFLAAAVLALVGGLGWVYSLTAVGFGIVFLWAVVRLHRDPTRTSAMRSFHASNAYLGALLVAVVIDVLVV